MRNVSNLSLAMVCALGVAGSATAVPLAYEGFDYSTGASLAGQGGTELGFGAGAAWFNTNGSIAVGSGSPIYSDGTDTLVASSNSASVPATSSFNQSLRDLTTPTGTGDVWVSWLMNPSQPEVGYSQFVIRESGLGGGGGAPLVAVGNDSDTTDLYVEVNGARIGLSSGFTLASDTTYFFAVNIVYDDAGDESINVYANSSLSTPTGLVATATAELAAVGRFSILAGSNSTPPGNTVFDEIRMGTTFADVSPVPEPASLVLIGLSGLAMLGRRRAKLL